MMSSLPAKVAGVGSHCLHTVRAGRAVPPGTLIACDICGADAVFVSASQAVAAMATAPKQCQS